MAREKKELLLILQVTLLIPDILLVCLSHHTHLPTMTEDRGKV